MSGFDEREKDFERKHAHDAKMDFRIEARCSKLFGLWIADKMGITEAAEAQAYAMEVVKANLEMPGFEDLLDKVKADLKNRTIDISDRALRAKLEETHEEARREIFRES